MKGQSTTGRLRHLDGWRRVWRAWTLATALLAACAAQPTTLPPQSLRATAAPPRPEIRFALIGEPTDVNVWALFDEPGARYANYAIRWEYWPRLLGTSVPEGGLAPLAAAQVPRSVAPGGDRYVGRVDLRRDLVWTDGEPFTAQDVAFTVNTALAFNLGVDWANYYPADLLEEAEADGAYAVNFHFLAPPDVGAWQYGALQGPIVQRAYWRAEVERAAKALPDADLRSALLAAGAEQKALQQQVDALSAQMLALQGAGGQDRELESSLKRKQGDLDAANNTLAELGDLFSAKMTSAREILYALDDVGEPTLGAWMPAGAAANVWTNAVNPAFPFARPSFERASYHVFDSEDAALRALTLDEVDAILSPDGLSPAKRGELERNEFIVVRQSPSSRMRYLALNHGGEPLGDPAIRHAIACLLGERLLSAPALDPIARPASSFVPQGTWRLGDEPALCASSGDSSGRQRAVDIMGSSGYTWAREPTAGAAGDGLNSPKGEPFPTLTLLVLKSEPARLELAAAVEQSLEWVGIPVIVSPVDSGTINYVLLSSGTFDLAIVGWRVPAYPGYLCDWFGDAGSFDYGSERIHQACDELAANSEVVTAQHRFSEVESILAEDLPFVPAYMETTLDAYRNLNYPGFELLDGISGNYGAPSLASPAP